MGLLLQQFEYVSQMAYFGDKIIMSKFRSFRGSKWRRGRSEWIRGGSKWSPGGSVGQGSQIIITLMMSKIRIRIKMRCRIQIRGKVTWIRNPEWVRKKQRLPRGSVETNSFTSVVWNAALCWYSWRKKHGSLNISYNFPQFFWYNQHLKAKPRWNMYLTLLVLQNWLTDFFFKI
jgi:hypothetical protein